MRVPSSPGGDSPRHNNIGSLRLAFAALVVVSHSPEVIDGNRSRELLTSIFGTLSFGEVAVDGFFLISGYLIIKSFLNSASVGDYLTKRILRIYPGFVVASLVSIFVVGPFSGADLARLWPYGTFKSLVLLNPPYAPGAFAGLHYPALNGSMWTIAYEFRCYLAVILIGRLATRSNRMGYAALMVGLAALYVARFDLPTLSRVTPLLGRPVDIVRLTFVFFVGGAFYVWRDRIAYTGRGALIAAPALVALFFIRPLAEPAFAILGGYLTFWYAFARPANRISHIVSRTDPSYGLYLYAWPVQELIIFYDPGISPWTTTAIALPVALALGIASWSLVEKPALNHKDLFGRSRRTLRASPEIRQNSPGSDL